MDGWIKLHRKVMKSSMYRQLNSKQRDVMFAVLLLANHESNTWEFRGEVYNVKPGQFITSLDSLKENCASDVTTQNIRTALLKLEKHGFLTNESTKKNRLITVVNWGLYQSCESATNKETNRQLTNNQQTANKQLTTNKNDKELKNEKNDKKVKPLSRNKNYSEDSVEYKMALYLHTKIMEHANESGVAHLVEKANLQKWADDCRKLLEIDKIDKVLIRDVIDWTTSHSFWKSNILSASKLREKFQDLAIKMNSTKPKQEDRLDFINDL